MEMTNEKRQALIERCQKHIAWLLTLTPEAFTVCNSVKEQIDIYGIALAALTAEPVKVVPWDVKSCHECGSKSLTWQATVISNTPVQNGRLRLNEVSGLFYLGCDECSETVARVDANEVACFLNACRAEVLRLNAIDNTAQQYEALAGWKMVPVEPTEEMVAAWRKDMNQSYAREFSEKIGEDEVVFAYQSMLAAAPTPC